MRPTVPGRAGRRFLTLLLALATVLTTLVGSAVPARAAYGDRVAVCANSDVPTGWVIADLGLGCIDLMWDFGSGSGWVLMDTRGAYRGTRIAACSFSPIPAGWVRVGYEAAVCGGSGMTLENLTGPPRPQPEVGWLDVVRPGKPFTVNVAGWAADPDAPQRSVNVRLRADDTGIGQVVASQYRGDLDATPYGPLHGFKATLSAPEGLHRICAHGVDPVRGTTTQLPGCRSVLVLGHRPVGSFDRITLANGRLRGYGWAADPDAPLQSIDVRLMVEGGPLLAVKSASLSRPDVTQVYPHLSSGRYGWSFDIPAPAGAKRFCLVALNIGQGANVVLGCREPVS